MCGRCIGCLVSYNQILSYVAYRKNVPMQSFVPTFRQKPQLGTLIFLKRADKWCFLTLELQIVGCCIKIREYKLLIIETQTCRNANYNLTAVGIYLAIALNLIAGDKSTPGNQGDSWYLIIIGRLPLIAAIEGEDRHPSDCLKGMFCASSEARKK